MMCVYIYIYVIYIYSMLIWLVALTILIKLVNGKDYPTYYGK